MNEKSEEKAEPITFPDIVRTLEYCSSLICAEKLNRGKDAKRFSEQEDSAQESFHSCSAEIAERRLEIIEMISLELKSGQTSFRLALERHLKSKTKQPQ